MMNPGNRYGLYLCLVLAITMGCDGQTGGGGPSVRPEIAETPRFGFSSAFPTVLGRLAAENEVRGPVSDIQVQGDVGYFVDALGLKVLDLADPLKPRVVSVLDVDKGDRFLSVSGDYAYIAVVGEYTPDFQRTNWLRVVDVSSPQEPAIVGSLEIEGPITDMGATEGRVFILSATSESMVQVIDVADPLQPVLLTEVVTPGFPDGISIDGSFAYVFSSTESVVIHDFRDMSNPKIAATLDVPASQALFRGSTAYFVGESVNVVDVSDPANPQIQFELDTPGWGGSALVGDLLLLTQNAGVIEVVDVGDPAQPREVGAFEINDNSLIIAGTGKAAYVGSTRSGLIVVDIQEPTQLAQVDVLQSVGSVTGVAVSGDYAYLASGPEWGLQIVDVTNSTQPVLVGGIMTPGAANEPFPGSIIKSGAAKKVVVSGDLAYIADGGGGLQVADVSDVTNPKLLGGIDTPGSAVDVAIAGDRAYVANYDPRGQSDSGAEAQAGLQIIAIANPQEPQILGSLHESEIISAVHAQGGLVYLTAYEPDTAAPSVRFEIVDLSEPTEPVVLGSSRIRFGYANDLVVVDGLAYIAMYWADSLPISRMVVLDVNDVSNPVVVSEARTTGIARGVWVEGSRAYLADYEQGLRVIDVSDPFQPAIIETSNTPGEVEDVFVLDGLAYVADGIGQLEIVDVSAN